jgi:hypothetical protein
MGPLHKFGEMLWPFDGFGVGCPEHLTLVKIKYINALAEGKPSASDFRVGLENCRVMDAI